MQERKHSSVNYLSKQLLDSKNIAILVHTKPDADALCSAIVMKRIIKKYFCEDEKGKIRKKIHIFAEDLNFDEKLNPIYKNEVINPKPFKQYDLAIGLDSPTTARFGIYKDLFDNCSNTVNIDHHESNEEFAKNNIKLEVSSTCEVLYHICKYLKLNLSDASCRHIYCGIITDTNDLTSGKIKASTYKIIAEFMSKQLDIQTLRKYFVQNNTIEKTRLEQRAMNSMVFYKRDRIAIMQLTNADYKECKTDSSEALGFVDNAMKIGGVQIGILFREMENNTFNVSLRSSPVYNINVGEIATIMGGGGSKEVAAFQVKIDKLEDLKIVKEKLLNVCKKQLIGDEEDEDITKMFNE